VSEETQQERAKTNLIPNPLNQAFLAGSAAGLASLSGSLFFDVLPDQAFKMASGVFLAGAGFSLYLSWYDGRARAKPRKRRGRQIPFNHYRGSQKIDMELSIGQPGYVTRESWPERLNRWVYGKGEAKIDVKPTALVPRPAELDEFVFLSQGLQLREVHVKLFLKSAWRNRKNGKGLSERRWVREFSQRPAWYQELSTDWYYAIMRLLADCQRGLGYQLIVYNRGNNWLNMANEPFMTMRLLKWHESEKRKV
jgi:hypothetical protein